jgi:hypothetical protein
MGITPGLSTRHLRIITMQDGEDDTTGRGAAAEAAAAAEARLLPARLQRGTPLDRKRAWTADEDQTLLDSWLRCAIPCGCTGCNG